MWNPAAGRTLLLTAVLLAISAPGARAATSRAAAVEDLEEARTAAASGGGLSRTDNVRRKVRA